jgi:PadR family transcriptional regulator, regulatory protein PadR
MADLEPRNFLQPCLLLLLAERADHGYELASRLRPLHDGEGDSGGVYRALRALEKHGLVRSEWRTSEVGPARRTYRVTPAGLALLAHQVHELQRTHDVLHVFLERYTEVAAPPRHDPIPARSHAYQVSMPSPRVAETESTSAPGRTR